MHADRVMHGLALMSLVHPACFHKHLKTLFEFHLSHKLKSILRDWTLSSLPFQCHGHFPLK